MSDYIKKEDAREVIRETCRNLNYLTPPVSQLTTAIDKAPSADVEPVRHGHWDEDMECSMCGCLAPVSHVTGEEYAYDYCPNCGARMDGKEQEHERTTL